MLGSYIASSLLVLLAWSASAQETVGTFTLDALSFISFGNEQVVLLPSGSTIKFRFSKPGRDGSATFRIAPEDVSIAPVRLPDGGTLEYALGATASGTMAKVPDGREIDFTAIVRATLARPSGGGTFDYLMPFSTSGESATSLDGSQTLSRTGMHVVDGVWYGQIIGATTNREHAFPGPGAAVYSVLSGRFDVIP